MDQELYSKICLLGSYWVHENLFLITGGVSHECIIMFLDKDWGMKIIAL